MSRRSSTILGPLTNPSRTRHQLVGVSDPAIGPVMAGVFGATGSRRTLIVHADDGLDELSVTSPSNVLEVRGDGSGDYELTEWRVDPAALGFAPATLADLRGGDAAFNAGVIRSVLEGEQGARRDIGVLNAAAALMVAGRVDDLESRRGPGGRGARQREGRSVCSTRWSLRRKTRCAGSRADPPGAARRMRRGIEGRRVRAAQRDDAPAEAAAGHAGAEHAGLRDQVLDQLVDRRHGDPVVDGQAAVSLGHEGAEGDQVAPAQQSLRLAHPGALGDDVARPPAQHGIGRARSRSPSSQVPRGRPRMWAARSHSARRVA